MKRHLFSSGVALVVLLVMGVCAASGKKKPKPIDEPEAPTATKISGKLPTFAPLAETDPTQEKSGLRITVTPVEYQVKTDFLYSDARVHPSFKESMLGPDLTRNMLVERTYRPIAKIEPVALRFKVHVSNQMPRVFRGAGIVVQFNVAGKAVQYDPTGTTDLVQAIIPPRSEQFLDIYGPAVADFPDRTTIGVFFYDVVTKIDPGGNVIEKQNFEWYFQYATKVVEEEVAVPPPQRRWVPIGRR